MKRKKIKDGKIVITGIICVTLLELFALYKGHDGMILTTVVALVAGLAGWTIPTPKFMKQ